MDIKRRNFLKIAGLTAIAGVGAPAAVNMLFQGDAQASAPDAQHGAEPRDELKAAGKRYGMVVDTRKFNRYKSLAQSCIRACHYVHNVPNFGNPKDEIKWIWEADYEEAFPNHSQYYRNEKLEHSKVVVMCNHCDNPPCVRVCPTKATFKNKDGIVVMDFHRCIGCRFCMAACPYGARSFNWRDPRGKDENGRPFIAQRNPEFPTRMRGVVEKCNFCAERLAKGLQPACVEACGNTKALVFGDLNDPDSEIRKVLRSQFTIQRKPELGTKPSLFFIV